MTAVALVLNVHRVLHSFTKGPRKKVFFVSVRTSVVSERDKRVSDFFTKFMNAVLFEPFWQPSVYSLRCNLCGLVVDKLFVCLSHEL